jgi:hypothetical protein
MAQLFLDSFDHYADADKTAKWTQYVPGTAGDITVGAFGDRSTNGLRFRTTNTAAFWTGVLNLTPSSPTPSGDTLIVGFRLKSNNPFAGWTTGTNPDATGGTAPTALFVCRYSGTNQWWVRWESTGKFSVLRGTTLLGTTSFGLSQSVFSYVEFKVKLSTSGGTVDIRIDGQTALSLTGQNTRNGSADLWDEIRFGQMSSNGGINIDINLDDFYLADGSGSDGWTDFMGDMRIDATYPTSDGTHSDFTRSTGANQYATIDEASANGDSDYNSSGTNFAMDTLNFPNAPVSGATILGLQVVAHAKKADAGPAGHKAVVRIGGTDYTGTEHSLSSSYTFVREQFPLKPSDNTAWTDTDYNAAEFGYQKST